MSNLFKKVACFTDLHIGMRHNAKEHNEDCVNFIKWFIETAKAEGAETCIFLGDFHHHRNTISISSLNYSMQVIRLLSENFKQVFMIVGNHDNFYRQKREVHSLVHGSEFKNVTIVDDMLVKDDVAILPWLVEDEWKTVKNIKTKYMFGHFEIPGFKFNAMIEMPDHGQINKTHFKHQEYVFSGHFHKRQQSGNVHYIGNPFGHNYADAWDKERGMMVLEWDGKPKYINYDRGPNYISCSLSELLKNYETYLKPNTYAKVSIDIEISYEEANFIRDNFTEAYGVREIKLLHEHKHDVDLDISSDVEYQSVDQLVVDQLSQIETKNFDIKKLIEIYNTL